MIDTFKFYKKKYGTYLLIDILKFETLEDYYNLQKPYRLAFRKILLVNKGKADVQIDYKNNTVHKNSVVFVNPMQVIQWDVEKTVGGLALIFEEDFLSTFFTNSDYVKNLNFFQANSENQTIELNDTEMEQLKSIFHQIEKEILNDNNRSIHLLRALLYQSLSLLEKKYAILKDTNYPITTNTTVGNSIVTQFENLVEQSFKTKHSVGFYADQLNISVGYLNSLIKNNLHTTAKRYIMNRLFLEAKRLLNYSALSVSEIAWKLNFEDESYFVRAFKKESGYTPKNYRALVNS